MSQERYQVTRSGREIYTGDLDGLVQAAAQGTIRANDLVFDAPNDRWTFARNLPELAGFALRGRKAYGTTDAETDGPITLDKLALERRGQRRARLIQALAFLAVVGLTLVLVRMVPTATDKRQLSEFIEDREQPEGDVRPPQDAPAPPRAPAAAAAPTGTAAAAPTGTAAAAAAPTGTAAAPAQAAGAALDPAAPAAPAAAAPAGTAAAPRPPVGPPAELAFDYARRDDPGVFIEPTPEQRRRRAARYLAEGMRALADPRPPPGDARLAQLLAARHRAEFARLNLEALDPDHPDLPQAEQLIADIEAEFTRLCQPPHGERFCGLKLQYPDWPDPVVERVVAGRVDIGMTAEQAREAWGRPTRFRREGEGRRYCYDFLCERSLVVVDHVVTEVGG